MSSRDFVGHGQFERRGIRGHRHLQYVLLTTLLCAATAFAQVDEAKRAIESGEYARAITILSDALSQNPTADTYLYLGIAYANVKEYEKAGDTLQEGSNRYPNDARFHNELAGINLANRDVEAAKTELKQALQVDPQNNYASDLLATIDISEGEVQSALRTWNRSGRPVIDDIFHNYYLNFQSWVVRESIAFHPSSILQYSQWKTTEARLFAVDNFANVSLEVEPTVVPDRYNAVVRTTAKTNKWSDIVFGLFKGSPLATSYFDLWDIGNSGINWTSKYRWDSDQRKAEGHLNIPLPVPGVLRLDLGNTWRSERWDVSRVIKSGRPQFDYRANGLRVQLTHIPHYRFEFGGGFEYVNRYAKGDLPELGTDSRNNAQFIAHTTLRFADGVYQNRLKIDGFLARKSVLGDFNYSGAVAEFNNRVMLSKDTQTYLDWTIKSGTSHGQLPVENYFVLGLDNPTQNLLRGHTAADHGRYGRGPMGTDFVLSNLDMERKLVTIPLFNTLNLPYILVKAEVFLDAAKTWDRNRIFQQGKLWLDTGAGLRFETPTASFNVVYGRSLREGKGILYGYVERRLW